MKAFGTVGAMEWRGEEEEEKEEKIKSFFGINDNDDNEVECQRRYERTIIVVRRRVSLNPREPFLRHQIHQMFLFSFPFARDDALFAVLSKGKKRKFASSTIIDLL